MSNDLKVGQWVIVLPRQELQELNGVKCYSDYDDYVDRIGVVTKIWDPPRYNNLHVQIKIPGIEGNTFSFIKGGSFSFNRQHLRQIDQSEVAMHTLAGY